MDGHRLRRAVLHGGSAAVVGGLLSAAVTRVLMAVVAVLTGDGPEPTVVGTVGIAVFYVLVLLPGAVALAWSATRWSWALYLAGVLLLAFEAVAIGLQETADSRDLTIGAWVLLVGVLTAMAAVYVGQVVWVARAARRGGRWSDRPAGEDAAGALRNPV